MAERLYTLRGKSLTAAQVADLDDVTDAEKKQFAEQAGMSDRDLQLIETLCSAAVPPLREFIVKAMAPLVDRIAALQKAVTEFEQRPPVEWEVYSESKEYKPGVFVTFAGGMWFSRSVSKGVRPGSGNDCWRLCVKRGDAK